MLAAKAVSRLVGETLHLDDVTLTLEAGRPWVVLGPTGAGKTSLLRVLAGLDRPSEGRLLLDGVDITRQRRRRLEVAMVFAGRVNYPSFTVYDNLAAALRLRGFGWVEVDRRVKETAERLRLERVLQERPETLTPDLQQRVAIARAFVKEAELVLLDEPLAGLDKTLAAALRDELRALFAEQPKTIVVYATTEPTEALEIGGNVVVLAEGRVLQAGPTLEVYHRPGSERVATTISDPAMNMLDVTLRDGRLRTKTGTALPLDGPVTRLPAGRYRLGIRAHQLALERRTPDAIELEGEVELVELAGGETFVHLRFANVLWVVQAAGVRPLERGRFVPFYLEPQQLYVFGDTGALELAPSSPPLDAAA